MITLIIDTSHERSLVAFAKGADILLTLPLPIGLQSSSYLFPTIESGFQKLNLTSADLKEVAVTVGPGSFTGIRVGVAAAKGIAAPKELPLIGLCSLYGFIDPGRKYAAVIDARMSGAYVLLPGGEPRLVSKEELPQVLEGSEIIVGPNLKNFSFPEKREIYPDPSALMQNALPREESDLNLIYLRDTVS